MKLSIVIPVYYNHDNLIPLYEDIRKKIIDVIDYDYEIVFVDDGSEDNSFDMICELQNKDKNIKSYRLSRNFGSHAAMLCGLSHCTGDCAVVKAADLQEPTELILEMVEKWKKGANVVLAVRDGRDEGRKQIFFANMYYWLVRKTMLKNMPEQGFDVYLIDRKVINVLESLDERNSALTGQILWSGFRTEEVYYRRLAREIGESRWTLKKKVRLVADTFFSFSILPIKVVTVVGFSSLIGAVIWAIIEVILKLTGNIQVSGWTALFIFNLLSFGITMFAIGILGEYIWRIFDASRNRPTYIIEETRDGTQTGDSGVRE